jgi:hypothetical protein
MYYRRETDLFERSSIFTFVFEMTKELSRISMSSCLVKLVAFMAIPDVSNMCDV